MKRTTLTAQQAVWLSEVFDRNRRLYGGFRMEDAPADKGAGDGSDKPDADKASGQDGDKPGGDQALGEGGKKALDAERDARKVAEDQVKALKGEFDGFKSALTEALGIKTKDGDGQQDALTAVQQQLAAIQRESAVLKLANEHKITDSSDMEILATAKDADSMKKLAERLAPKEQEQDRDARSRRPKPDSAQGGTGKNGRTGGGSVAQVMADRAAARAAKNPA